MDSGQGFKVEHLLDTQNLEDPFWCLKAVHELDQQKDTLIPLLLTAMQTQPDRVKRGILTVLIDYNRDNQDPRLFAPMLEWLTSNDPILAGRAFEVIRGSINEIWPDLLRLLPGCSVLVKLEILQAMQQIHDPRLIDQLMQLLPRVASSSERYTIIEVLGNLAVPGTPEVIALIQTYRDDPDHHVQARVARALDRLVVRP